MNGRDPLGMLISLICFVVVILILFAVLDRL